MFLVVDDSAFSRKATRQTLQRLGYDVQEASDVPAALQMLGSLSFECVVTDLLMPGLSGLDLLDRMNGTWSTPVVVLTSDVQTSTLQRCLEKGARTVVNKPVSEDKLKGALAVALGAANQ